MREMQVLNAEAERLFTEQLAGIGVALQEREAALGALSDRHRNLKDASVDGIQSLQRSLQDLQKSCEELEVGAGDRKVHS